jgi:hypothetical protein
MLGLDEFSFRRIGVAEEGPKIVNVRTCKNARNQNLRPKNGRVIYVTHVRSAVLLYWEYQETYAEAQSSARRWLRLWRFELTQATIGTTIDNQ